MAKKALQESKQTGNRWYKGMGDCPWWHHWYPLELFKVPSSCGQYHLTLIVKGHRGKSGRGLGVLLVY